MLTKEQIEAARNILAPWQQRLDDNATELRRLAAEWVNQEEEDDEDLRLETIEDARKSQAEADAMGHALEALAAYDRVKLLTEYKQWVSRDELVTALDGK